MGGIKIVRKSTTKKELRKLFKNEPTILSSLENVWEKQSTARYFPKVKYMTRKNLIEALKDEPIIQNALKNAWNPKVKCEECSIEFVKNTSNHKYCSKTCRDKGTKRKPLTLEQRERKNFLQREQQRRKALENRIEKKCGMCGKTWEESAGIQRYTCSTKCYNEYNKLMERALKWD